MSDGKTERGAARSTPQEGLELDPSEHDASANHDVESMAIDPPRLFEQALEQTRMAIALTDATLPDNPLVYVNQAFVELTGYEREEAIGRNCRFLQGPDTEETARQKVHEAIEAEEVMVVELLNYRKDGSTFWNALHVGPVYDEGGRLTHYYGSQWDVTEMVGNRTELAIQSQVAAELQHRTANLFNVITSILRLSARAETDTAALVRKLEGRITALAHAHRISLSEAHAPGGASDLHDLISAILRPYRSERRRRIILNGELVRLPRDVVTPLGLMLHELATNALKYGAFSVPQGTVTVEWRREGDRLRLSWTEEEGPPATAPTAKGTGSHILEGILRMIGATLDYDWPPTGLVATLDMRLGFEG